MTFSKEFEVHYYEVNKFQKATPVSILNYLEETAISHSESVGWGINNLKERGCGWVLNHWILHMDRYPMWSEKIRVETWPYKFERFYATREYIIRGSRGEILGKATTRWIYLNINKKRPVRIPEDIINSYGIASEKAIDEKFNDIDVGGIYENKKDFYVRKSDIDTNNHVNNTKYIEWMFEVIPDDIYDNFNLKTLEVIYKKETKYGETIISSQRRSDEKNSTFSCIHKIINSENDAVLSVGKSSWEKRI